MRLTTKNLVAAFAVFAILGCPQARAGEEEGFGLEDEFALLEEAEIVESAARHKQDIGMSPSAITVITRKDIEASGASTIPDLLRLVPGMDVIVVSASFTAITSRLFWTNENNHYLVLIDGRDASIELLGQVPWDAQPISLDDVERIEIIRGPASSLYGASAMAGVISITTRAVPEKTSAFARLSGGEVGFLQGDLRASTRMGDFGFSLSGGVDFCNSFTDPREPNKRLYRLRAVGEYHIDESSRISLDAAVSDGIGEMATSVGRIDAAFGLRTVKLAYDSENLSGRILWNNVPVRAELESRLEYGGVSLAEFIPMDIDMHSIDAGVHWRLPTFWDPLLIIIGGGGRAAWIGSDQLLDGDTYADPNSSRFHKPGVSRWEVRGGAFVHSELEAADWVTVTLGLRFDDNTETDWFLSPRLAAVFKPHRSQFIRVGVARAFRKPAYVETDFHPLIYVPPGSPMDRTSFLEFASTIIGNPEIDNEELISFEVGYLGRFLDGKLSVALDLYYNQLRGLLENETYIVRDSSTGLPDLDRSYVMSMVKGDFDIMGGELSVRYTPVDWLSLTASWSHRQVYDWQAGKFARGNPINLITLGGRFGTEEGLVGSLYLFTRSEFEDLNVENPEGLLAPRQTLHMDNVMLILARLGWRFKIEPGVEIEAGGKFFLPVSPFAAPHFRYYEEGGGVWPDGTGFGGEQLRRILSFYLQGSF